MFNSANKAVSVGALIATIFLSGGINAAEKSDSSLETYDLQKLTAHQAYIEGRNLRAQFKNIQARTYLKYAADKGDAQSAYLYAMELSNYKTTIRTPTQARDYLLLAAHDGNIPAMKSLYEGGEWLRIRERQYWKREYFNAIVTLGQTQPTRALLYLSEYYEKSDPQLANYYLDQSVERGYPRALMLKAREIAQGEGSYWTSGSRDKAAYALYEDAAKQGYIPAIRKIIQLLESKGDFKQALEWRKQAVKEGDLTSLAAVAMILSGYSSNYQFVEKDLATAKAYFDVYLDTAGDDRLDELYKNIEQHYSDLMKVISPDELKASQNIEKKLKEKPDFYNHDLFWDV
ncbi:MAG: tetratricopeptide repeat protein [Vibrio sp.]